MSLRREVTVHCDLCGRWEHTAFPSSQESRADRERRGWKHTGGMTIHRRDLCPACAEREARIEGQLSLVEAEAT